MRGQIKGDAQALLAGGQIALVKGIALLHRAESGILGDGWVRRCFQAGRMNAYLADGPGPIGVHGGIGSARIWILSGKLR